ncbi:MAG: 30S ribosomal protein S9 [bacterium ADurb.Bin400]|nr:MAG: 30S ribosomal protein S9 [bacterium ADurb.Bin400]
MAETKTTKRYWTGTGRRKTAVASVRITEDGTTSVVVNGKDTDLPSGTLAPLELVGKKGSFGLSVRTTGGGKMGQLEAIRHGISRALESYNPEFRTTLKKAGFLTRDPREKERKKPGLKRARRAPQWAKR